MFIDSPLHKLFVFTYAFIPFVFTGRQLGQGLLFNKVADWRLKDCNLSKKGLRQSCWSMNFAKFFRPAFLWNTCKQLLLYIAWQCDLGKCFVLPNFCSSIWLTVSEVKKQKRCFWFVYKFKIKFVLIFNYSLFTRLT